ncbi:LapD/MoxY N-terminal periplasmic domain-containing protein [Sulfurivirga sp.]|uniref:bifunctional diguanylate cyclase/phosphodiesterase n=1 Tax=Sulfurivirga sp. TaxID=2614236 RepID=UPI0025E328BA|nr:LapD/MoxY N-terminal periplasmic domain-containing protein [Sulfurivirga sp.]
MSLRTQLSAFILGLLLTVLAANFWLNLDSTRAFLQNQLKTHAEDTATSLGVTLSHAVRPDDLAAMETFINAVFDRGYYLSITLTGPDGKVRYRRQNPLKIEGVPAWFIRLLNLHPEAGKAEIMSGWIPVGQITVVSHPGYAYEQLWESFVNLLILFAVLGGLFLALSLFYLHHLLAPLKKMVRQAQAIVQKHYVVQEPLPGATELRQVVSAINTMVLKLKDIFTREAEINARLQRMAYADPVTGLGNRAFFEMVLDSALADDTCPRPGALAIVHLHDLQTLNERHGYPQVNRLIQRLVKHMVERLNHLPETTLARLNGSDFAILASQTDPADLAAVLQTLPELWAHIKQDAQVDPSLSPMRIGVAYYLPDETRAEALTRANGALQQAETEGEALHRLTPPDDSLPLEKVWHIEEALETGRLTLLGQPVQDGQNALHSLEVLAQLRDGQGNPIAAREFTPLLQREGLEAQFDRLVVDKTLGLLGQHPELPLLSVNLTEAAVIDLDFQRWLLTRIREARPRQRIAFELPEALLHRHSDACAVLIQHLHQEGCRVGLDHFGRHLGDKRFLQLYKPDYLKLAPGFVEGVCRRDDKATSYLASLVEMAGSLDIDVIATAVEDTAVQQRYAELGVRLFQGYHIGRPIDLKEWIARHER